MPSKPCAFMHYLGWTVLYLWGYQRFHWDVCDLHWNKQLSIWRRTAALPGFGHHGVIFMAALMCNHSALVIIIFLLIKFFRHGFSKSTRTNFLKLDHSMSHKSLHCRWLLSEKYPCRFTRPAQKPVYRLFRNKYKSTERKKSKKFMVIDTYHRTNILQKKFRRKSKMAAKNQDGRFLAGNLGLSPLLLVRFDFAIHQIVCISNTYNFVIYMHIQKLLRFRDKKCFLKNRKTLFPLIFIRFSIVIHQNLGLEEPYNFLIYMCIQKVLGFRDKNC
jgi:hypothetical protein